MHVRIKRRSKSKTFHNPYDFQRHTFHIPFFNEEFLILLHQDFTYPFPTRKSLFYCTKFPYTLFQREFLILLHRVPIYPFLTKDPSFYCTKIPCTQDKKFPENSRRFKIPAARYIRALRTRLSLSIRRDFNSNTCSAEQL